MRVIVRPGKTDRRAWRIELPPPRKTTLKEYKIGLWLDDPASPVDSRVAERLHVFVDELSRLTPHLADRRPNIDFSKSHAVYTGLSAALNGSTLPPAVFDRLCQEKTALDGSNDAARSRFVRGATQLHREWVLAHTGRIRLQQRWAAFFEDFDALLMPVAPVPAFPHDHRPFYERRVTVNGRDVSYVDALYAWPGLAGLAYLPATVMPAGLTSTGLPVGIQIVGPYLEDRTPIHLAALIEDALGGFVPPCLP
jgi:amidase